MGSPDPVDNASSILVLFDGVCNLCNGTVQFIIKRDPQGRFKFASLQSATGRTQLTRFNLNPDVLYSFIVIDGDRMYERSDAALFVAEHLALPWKAFTIFKILPRSFRDACYNLIAKNRYRLFGKQDRCMIPTPELKARFLG
jgi:predicted DCC family thiol-disulfide oxidoreductase YuxK